MANKRTKQWNRIISNQLRRGITLKEIENTLTNRYGYTPKAVKSIISAYKERALIKLAIPIILIVLAMLAPFYISRPTITGYVTTGPATTYYVDSIAGLDTNDGLTENTALRSIRAVNAISKNPGDKILFKRGSSWRITSDERIKISSGQTNQPITYAAYGTGTRPSFVNSYAANLTSDWTSIGSNKWQSTASFSSDVGIIIFNHGEFFGTREYSLADVDTDGDFYRDTSTGKITIKFPSNPASNFHSVEIGIKSDFIYADTASNVVIANLSLRYGGRHGIDIRNAQNVVISDCELTYIGGALQTGLTRYGNGIQIGLGAQNVLIERNIVSEVYDAAITVQAWEDGSPYTIRNVTVRNNLMADSAYGFEYFNSNDASQTQDLSINHNTIVNSHRGWYASQRPLSGSIEGRSILMNKNPLNSRNITITNNILYDSRGRELNIGKGSTNWRGPLPIIERNLIYHTDNLAMIYWNGTNYNTVNDFESFAIQGVDNIETNPKFNNEAGGDYTLELDSAGCVEFYPDHVGAYACQIEIVNNPPLHQQPMIINKTDSSGLVTSLSCINVSTIDMDGDQITNIIAWFQNGVVLEGENSGTVTSETLEANSTVVCQMTPFDGQDYGVPLNSSSLYIPQCSISECNTQACSNCSQNISNTTQEQSMTLTDCNLPNMEWSEDSGPVSVDLASCFGSSQATFVQQQPNTNITINISEGMALIESDADWHGILTVSFIAWLNGSNRTSNLAVITVHPTPDCNDGQCEAEETCSSCPSDCGQCSSSSSNSGKGGGGGSGSSLVLRPSTETSSTNKTQNATPLESTAQDKKKTPSASVIPKKTVESVKSNTQNEPGIEQPTEISVHPENAANGLALTIYKYQPALLILIFVISIVIAAKTYSDRKSHTPDQGDPYQAQVIALRKYVMNAHLAGLPQETICANLIRAGWPEQFVLDLVPYILSQQQ